MAASRNYKAEYARRIASAERRGLSRSQGRGHARHGETAAKLRLQPAHDDQLETGLKLLRKTGNLSRAAKETGVSPERLRRFARNAASAQWVGRSWQLDDQRLRTVSINSASKQITIQVRGFDAASIAGKYNDAVSAFLTRQNREVLGPFDGMSITDAKGKSYMFETSPNALYRIDAAGEPAFHEIYRIISTES